MVLLEKERRCRGEEEEKEEVEEEEGEFVDIYEIGGFIRG